MPFTAEYWDTKSNEEAEGSIAAGMRRGEPDDGSDRMEDARENEQEPGEIEDAGGSADEFPLTESQLMRLVKSAYSQGTAYQQDTLQPRWTGAYRAYNNQHEADSKYLSTRFRGRSRLFRPKTRSTARKKQAEAASALFSTNDAILIQASDETDARQKASAELTSELIRFRLHRASGNAGIPWFMISMGAHLTAQQTAICISKQYWEYRKKQIGTKKVPIEIVDPMTGQPVTVGYQDEPEFKIERDRPRIQLIPPEDVIRDPAAAWEDQAQDSSYIIIRNPMSVEAAITFVEGANEKSAMRFRDVEESEILAAAGVKNDSANSGMVRRAREHGGNDRYTDHTVDASYQQVWLHENFFRIGGEDYVFWTLGEDKLISDVVPVEQAYPECDGARPIVIGIATLEPFKTDPMAPIQAWREMQREMNDLVNLRLDTAKQTIAPLAKVKRGRSVDIRALQNRSPDSVVYMQDMTDVEFDRPGDVGQAAYVEMEKLNADFDDQAGNFSIGSVQSNRQLGETVGGMKMMSSNANAMGEFDLRVWVETWVEPVLRQIVALEQYYENDQTLIALSAKRAKLFDRYKIDQITDDMLSSNVTVSVDVGLGSSDPMMSLQKFGQASQIVAGLLGQSVQSEFKRDAIIDEVFGKAGYQDASERFFNKTVEEDPRMAEAQKVIQELQAALQEAEQAIKDKDGDHKTQIKVAQIGAVKELAKQEMSQQHQMTQTYTNAVMNEVSGRADHARNMETTNAKAQHARAAQQDKISAQGAQKGQAGQAPGQGPQAAGGAPMPSGPQGPSPQFASMLGMGPPPQQAAAAPDELKQGLAMLAQMIAKGQQALLQQVQQGNQQILAAMTAPKRVIRDGAGNIVGVVPDMGPMGQAQQAQQAPPAEAPPPFEPMMPGGM